jgi:membrane protein
MQWRRYADLAKQATSAWVDDRAPSMGAALSYYTVFSIAPLLLIVISLAGLFFSREAAQGAIVGQLSDLIGSAGAHGVEQLLRAVARPREGVIATVVGVVVLLVGATTVFAELEDDLNRIWKVPPKAQPSGLWGWLRARLLSIGMILAIGFLLLVSLAASAVLASLDRWSSDLLGSWRVIAWALNLAFSFGVVTAMFAIIYRYLPQTRIEWHDVGVGAVVTALLFTIGKYLIGLYIGKSAVASGFGAAGSLAVLLLWVYYSAQIFLLGAEFTAAYAHAYGSRRGETKPAAGVPQAAGPAGARTASSPSPAASSHGRGSQPSAAPVLPVASAALPAGASRMNLAGQPDAPVRRPSGTKPAGPKAWVKQLRHSPARQFAGSAALAAVAVLAFEWALERPARGRARWRLRLGRT